MTLNKPQGLPVTGMGMGREKGEAGAEMVGWHSGNVSSSLQGDQES